MWSNLTDAAGRVGAETVPYSIRHGWFRLGGVAWGHGFMYNLSSLRDHAEMLGMPTVMAHLHYPHQVTGRTINSTSSFCVGSMADEEKLTYGHRRRNSLVHGHGIVFGEMNETESHLWLIKSENGKPFHFPPSL